MQDTISSGAYIRYRITRVIWFVFSLFELLLLFRFLLKLIGANASAGFTSFIYQLTEGPVSPFVNVINPTSIGGGVIEWGALLAIAVYWIFATAIVELIAVARPV